MTHKALQSQLRTDIPEFRSGDTVRVWQKITEGKKDRVQAFEGFVVARKHGSTIEATFTVRKNSNGVGVEKIYPLHSPTIERIEVLKRATNRKRSKMYWTRNKTDRAVRLKLKPQLVSQQAKEKPAKKEVQEKREEKSTDDK